VRLCVGGATVPLLPTLADRKGGPLFRRAQALSVVPSRSFPHLCGEHAMVQKVIVHPKPRPRHFGGWCEL